MTTINITEQTTTVTTVDEVTTITLANAGVQGASYNQGDPIYVVVRNATGATLSKGDVVYISGGNGVWTQVTKALATTNLTSTRVIGLIAETIANNASGLCMIEGYLDGVNTQGIAEGTQLYLSATTAGAFTATVPTAPNHQVKIGVCVKTSAGNGRIYIQIDNGSELGELHDVAISSPTNNQVLTYETSSGLWKNKDNTADGVQSVVFSSPLTGGTVTTAGTVGLDQTALTITQSQVTGLGTALAGKANLAGGNTFTDAQIINANNDATIALQVRRNSATATANIQQWTTSTGTALSTVDVLGYGNFARLSAGSSADLGYGILSVNTGGTANKGLIVRAVASQASNLTEWQDSAGGTSNFIGAAGNVSFALATMTVSTGGNMNLLGQARIGTTSTLGMLTVLNSTAANTAIVSKGASSQTGDLLAFQNSGGTVLARVSASGQIASGGTASTGPSFLGQITAIPASTATVGVVVQGLSGQSANLQEWQSSSGTVVNISPTGIINITNASLRINTQNTGFNARINVSTDGTAVIGAVIRASTGQSANLQEWQDSGGTVLARVNSGGIILGTSMRTLTSYFTASEESSGGAVILTKLASAGGNPGAGIGKLYFRDGTNAGTLKLVVRAGAAGAETTILDNIPT